MWDFHNHILPAIDDGAKSIEETIQMAKIAVEEGIHEIVATPHYIPYEYETHQEELKEHINRVNNILQKENIPLKILLGMEVYAYWDILSHIDRDDIATLNDSRYILIELPMVDIPIYIEDLFLELEVRDLVPILAHPERNAKIQKDPNILHNWIKKGLLTQVNTGSITGIFGEGVRNTAETLLKHNMVHIIGTDAHSPKTRSPRMKEAVNVIKTRNPEHAKLILEEYPKKIIADETITPMAPAEVKKKKKFWSRWKMS